MVFCFFVCFVNHIFINQQTVYLSALPKLYAAFDGTTNKVLISLVPYSEMNDLSFLFLY